YKNQLNILMSYKDQLTDLKTFYQNLQVSAPKEEEQRYQQLFTLYADELKIIQNRINEINEFRKKSPLRSPNDLAKELKLSQKIPSDQIALINEFSLQEITNLGEALDSKDQMLIKETYKNLVQLKEALTYYGHE